MRTFDIDGIIVKGRGDAEWGTVGSADLLEWLASVDDDVTIRVDSYGGECYGATSMAIALQVWSAEHPSRSITLEVEAVAMSAAAYLLVSAPARARIAAHTESVLMFHGASCMAWGGEGAMQDTADQLRIFNDGLTARLVEKTTYPEDVIRGWLEDGRAGWLTAADARAHGLIDEIIDGAARPAPAIREESNATEATRLVASYAVAAFREYSQHRGGSNMAKPQNEPLEPIPAPVPEPEPTPEEGELERLREERDRLQEELERTREDRDNLREERDRIREERDRLAEELERSRETVDKLTGGANPPQASAAGEDFAALMRGLPRIADVGQIAWDRAMKALKESHPVEYKNYISKRSTTNVR